MLEVMYFILEILLVIITVLIIWYVVLKGAKVRRSIKIMLTAIIFTLSFTVLSFFINSVTDKLYWLTVVYLLLFAIYTLVDWIRFLMELRKK